MLPPDLAARVVELQGRLEGFETQMLALEAKLKAVRDPLGELGRLRHDFNNMRQAIAMLMVEVDERVPIARKP